jgi:hypothetical protein
MEIDDVIKRIEAVTAKEMLDPMGESYLYKCAGEELGEYARATLIEDSVKTKKLDESSKEEAIDVIICAYSLFFARGGTISELLPLLDKKLGKWESRADESLRARGYPKITPAKKKSRHTVEGFDGSGVVCFEPVFVKLDQRPAFPLMAVADENGGHYEYEPGEQGFMICDVTEEHAIPLINGVQRTKCVVIKMYSGCAELITEWQFQNVTFDPPWIQQYDDNRCLDVSFKFAYKRSRCIQHKDASDYFPKP